jgi:hypothetical protein
MSIEAIHTNASFQPEVKREDDRLLITQIFNRTISGIRHDLPLYAIIAISWVAGYVYLSWVGEVGNSHFLAYFSRLLPLFVLFFLPALLLFTICKILLTVKRRKLLVFRFMLGPRNMGRILSGTVLVAAICIFMGMFTAVKTSFGHTYGFQHDVWQANLDAFLFAGYEPWEILFTPVHSIALQTAIEVNYNMIWHLLTFGTVFLFAIAKPAQFLRLRYLACFLLAWIVVGNVFAGLFISAGPAFYGLVTGDEARFGEQLEALSLFKNSSAVFFQDFLWNSYKQGHSGFGTGISAFPSMHVAVTVLNMIFAFEVSKKLGIATAIYFLFVLYSSVYLAWHYAVDGLFSGLVVAALYFAVKAIWNRTKNATA